MNASPPYIPILLCFDSNYANYAAVATYSAYKNSKSPLVFYWIITPDVEEQSKLLKSYLQKFKIEVTLITCDISVVSHWKTGLHFSAANYLRLFAPNLLVCEDKVVYLDCDTLVLTDLGDLYKTSLNGFLLGGVANNGLGGASKVPRVDGDTYINSGVLVMDLKGLRDDNFLEKTRVLYEAYESEITWADQCLINKYAEGKKFLFDQKWNRQIYTDRLKNSEFSNLALPSNSAVLHFLGPHKPWNIWCNPYIAKFWWGYAQDLGIENLKPVPISSIDHAISLADTQHLNEHYKDSSLIKSDVIKYCLKHIEELDAQVAEAKRLKISEELNRSFQGVVRYGPFKGLNLSEKSWWGAADRASMLLGLYEQEVLVSLQSASKKYRYFIDIGAADGYYGIGVIVAGLFKKSWCYEISQLGRDAIKANAHLNSVSNQIVIKGKADSGFADEFSDEDAAQSVLFVDIEGGEFELFEKKIFEKFRQSVIFIELHDDFFPDGEERLSRLREDAEKFFRVSTLTTTARDLSSFEELQELSDTDRWLICSEGRPCLMTWWRLDPL